MSRVSNLILITSNIEPKVKDFQSLLHSLYKTQMVKVDGYAGGNKGFEADVYMIAINYLNMDEFLPLFKKINWDSTQSVQLMIKTPEMDVFRFLYTDGKSIDEAT